MMNERAEMVMITADHYKDLATASAEAAAIKRYLERKLNRFTGITHSELSDICAMFGIEIEEV